MSAPITSLRAAYKAKRQQFKEMDGKWAADKSWAYSLELESGDYLGQVSKVRCTPKGYNELKAEVAALSEELKAAEIAALPVLDVFALLDLKKERKATRDLKIRLGNEWLTAGGAFPVPPELLAADARIQEITVEMERKASVSYYTWLNAYTKSLEELTHFHWYYGIKVFCSQFDVYSKRLNKEVALLGEIQYRLEHPHKADDYNAKGFWNCHDCLQFDSIVAKGLPQSPFLYNQDDPRNYTLPVEERLRVTNTPSFVKKPVDLVGMLLAASKRAHDEVRAEHTAAVAEVRAHNDKMRAEALSWADKAKGITKASLLKDEPTLEEISAKRAKRLGGGARVAQTDTRPALHYWQLKMVEERTAHHKKVEDAWRRAEARWDRVKPSAYFANKYATADPEVWEEMRVRDKLGDEAWESGATLEEVWG